MRKKFLGIALILLLAFTVTACGIGSKQDVDTPGRDENSSYKSVEGTQIKMIMKNYENNFKNGVKFHEAKDGFENKC